MWRTSTKSWNAYLEQALRSWRPGPGRARLSGAGWGSSSVARVPVNAAEGTLRTRFSSGRTARFVATSAARNRGTGSTPFTGGASETPTASVYVSSAAVRDGEECVSATPADASRDRALVVELLDAIRKTQDCALAALLFQGGSATTGTSSSRASVVADRNPLFAADTYATSAGDERSAKSAPGPGSA